MRTRYFPRAAALTNVPVVYAVLYGFKTMLPNVPFRLGFSNGLMSESMVIRFSVVYLRGAGWPADRRLSRSYSTSRNCSGLSFLLLPLTQSARKAFTFRALCIAHFVLYFSDVIQIVVRIGILTGELHAELGEHDLVALGKHIAGVRLAVAQISQLGDRQLRHGVGRGADG